MDSKFHYQAAEFGPSEVARLTGVSADAQRDWRRRGVIVMAVEGRARFFSEQVAQLIVRKALNDVGVPLTEAHGAVLLGGAMLYFEAMRQEGALDRSDMLTAAQHAHLDREQEQANRLRYFVVPHPEISAEVIEARLGSSIAGSLREMLPAWPADSLEDIGKNAETFQALGSNSFSVIDMHALAEKFAREAERPIATAAPGPSRSRSRLASAATSDEVDATPAACEAP